MKIILIPTKARSASHAIPHPQPHSLLWVAGLGLLTLLCLSLLAARPVLAATSTQTASTAQAAPSSTHEQAMPTSTKPAPLTVEEARIILEKGTERPYSGALLNNKATGTYTCRQCGAALYRSSDKFDSGCGWPSFDDAIAGAVKRTPDPDGHRVEITCNACGGHLGHVFEGEGFTAKNTRHCVNSVSMAFVPDTAPKDAPARKDLADKADKVAQPATATAFFAGGCFWGVEDEFSKVNGVLDAVSGYMGGTTSSPTYEQVSRGNTGHAEAVRVTYDPALVTYEQLARLFFEIHDPTQLNRQGPDVGTQYRSALFYGNDGEKLVAEKLVGLLREKGWKVVTELSPAAPFYAAEDYHQNFTKRTGRGACHLRVSRFTQSPRL